MPDRLRDMKELFMVEAAKYSVFPLDNSFTARSVTPRPSATAGRTVFTYSGESSGLPYSSAPDITGKSYSITAEVEIPQSCPLCHRPTCALTPLSLLVAQNQMFNQ